MSALLALLAALITGLSAHGGSVQNVIGPRAVTAGTAAHTASAPTRHVVKPSDVFGGPGM
jgi:hypothetical protein